MRDHRYAGSLLFEGQFRPDSTEILDPANYALSQEGRRIVGQINAERNKETVLRMSKKNQSAPPSSPMKYNKNYKCYSEQKTLVLTEAGLSLHLRYNATQGPSTRLPHHVRMVVKPPQDQAQNLGARANQGGKWF